MGKDVNDKMANGITSCKSVSYNTSIVDPYSIPRFVKKGVDETNEK